MEISIATGPALAVLAVTVAAWAYVHFVALPRSRRDAIDHAADE